MTFAGFHYTLAAAGHTGLKDDLRIAAEAGSPFALICSLMEGGPAVDAAAVSPKTKTVFRWTSGGDDPPMQGDPIVAARKQFAQALPIFRKNPLFTYYSCTNELNPGRGNAGANLWAAAYYLELMRQADANGIYFVWGNWSCGCPDYPDWVYYADVVRYAAEHGHPLGLHEYGLDAPATPDALQGSMRAGVRAEFVLRYRKVYQLFRGNGWGQPPLIITECAPGNHVNGDNTDNRLDVQMYDTALTEDYQHGLPVIGFALYNWGGAEAAPFLKFMPWLTTYVSTHPTPPIVTPPPPPLYNYTLVIDPNDVSVIDEVNVMSQPHMARIIHGKDVRIEMVK